MVGQMVSLMPTDKKAAGSGKIEQEQLPKIEHKSGQRELLKVRSPPGHGELMCHVLFYSFFLVYRIAIVLADKV